MKSQVKTISGSKMPSKKMQVFLQYPAMVTEDLPKPPDFQSPFPSMIQNFFRLGKWSLLVPYSIVAEDSSAEGRYSLRKSCLAFRILASLCACIVVVPFLLDNSKDLLFNHDYLGCFGVVANVANLMWIVCLLNLYWTVWFKSGEILVLVNQLDRVSEALENFGVKLPSKRLVLQFFIGVSAFYLTSATSVALCMNWKVQTRGVTETLLSNIHYAQLIFGLEGVNSTESSIQEILTQVPWSHQLLGLVWALANILCEYTSHWSDMFGFVHAYMYYLIVKGFIERLHSYQVGSGKYLQVLHLFEDICILADVMNSAIGSILVCSCFGMLPAYAAKLRWVFLQKYNRALQGFVYAGLLGSFLVLAATAHSMMEQFTVWLEKVEKQERFPSEAEQIRFSTRAAVAKHLIKNGDVGVRGKYFTVTYSFVGSFVSLVITYAILIVQLQLT